MKLLLAGLLNSLFSMTHTFAQESENCNAPYEIRLKREVVSGLSMNEDICTQVSIRYKKRVKNLADAFRVTVHMIGSYQSFSYEKKLNKSKSISKLCKDASISYPIELRIESALLIGKDESKKACSIVIRH